MSIAVDPVSKNEGAALSIVLCLVTVFIESICIYGKTHASSPPHVTYLLNKPEFLSVPLGVLPPDHSKIRNGGGTH